MSQGISPAMPQTMSKLPVSGGSFKSFAPINSGVPTQTGPSATASGGSAPAHVQEFVIRVPKNIRKKHHVMRFNATLNVDFSQWRMVKMERENNMKEFRGMEEDTPK